jgi:uncharacterized membrane protein YqiK
MNTLLFVLSSFGAAIVVLMGIAVLFKSFYRKVNQGEALIISKFAGDPDVTFTGGLVLPIVYRAETMDISLKTIDLSRRGSEGLICSDNIRADIQVTFFVRVNKTGEDVLKVAQSVGCKRASEPDTVRDLFGAKFSEALKTVGKRLEFVDLYEKRDQFRDKIIEVIGQDLNGYVLEDAAIDYLEQTPIEALDKENILDAEGIRKIRELTTAQNTRTNELVNKERMEISRQDTEAEETIFRYEQQRAEAKAKTDRDTKVAQVREEQDTERYTIEQMKNTALARQQADEEVQKKNEELSRNIEVARKQKERVIGVEEVEVVKARDLKEIEREREVELRRIAKEKELERERKDIADVIRTRIAVDKTVAEEEERIKDTRVLAEATRNKDSRIIEAEGAAQAAMIADIKKAEGLQEVAKFAAKERVLMADAELEASDREARAKIRLAEGIQAEAAAIGLADVRVREANAVAVEKEGLAKVVVRDAAAVVEEKEGMVRARVTREFMEAEAQGEEKKGMAGITVRSAEADVVSRMGEAEADAIVKRAQADATGISAKADAMRKLDERSRLHEEFRLRVQTARDVEMARIDVQRELADAQVKVLSSAMEKARVQIVGGDGAFFDQFVRALSMGNAVDGLAQQTEIGRSLLGGLIDGDNGLEGLLRDALSRSGLTADRASSLSPGELIGTLARFAGDGLARQVAKLAPEESDPVGPITVDSAPASTENP